MIPAIRVNRKQKTSPSGSTVKNEVIKTRSTFLRTFVFLRKQKQCHNTELTIYNKFREWRFLGERFTIRIFLSILPVPFRRFRETIH
jgi:hypothetical protein